MARSKKPTTPTEGGTPETDQPKLTVLNPGDAPPDCPESKAFMIADLKRSGLKPSDMPVVPVGVGEYDDLRYVILYPWDDPALRFKIDPSTSEDGRKYEQPANSASRPYARSLEEYEAWCASPVKMIVEGEKKAVAGMVRLGLPALGVGGCYNALASKRPWELHPDILAGVRAGDRVLLAFDGDMRTNRDVAKGVGSTAALLNERGCEVEVLVMPEGSDGRKVGLDDWLLTVPRGQEQRALAALERAEWESMPLADQHLAKQLHLVMLQNKDGEKLAPNHANLVAIVRRFFGHRMSVDRYSGPIFDGQDMRDYCYGTICSWVQGYYLPLVSLNAVKDAAREVLERSHTNALGDWLSGLKWDGKRRIKTFWQDYCNAEVNSTQDAAYLEDVAKVLFVGAALRGQRDGVKWDFLITLHGRQGVRKTTLWEVLGGEVNGRPLTVQARLDNDAELVRLASKCWFLNFDELAGKRKAEQQRLKNWLSQTSDSWVPKYQEHAQTSPRRCVAVATTNERDIVSDTTGNRRHLIVDVGLIEIDRVVRDRDQLYAEAMLLSVTDEAWWVVRNSEKVVEQYRGQHAWEEPFDIITSGPKPRLKDGTPFVTVAAIYAEVGHVRGDEGKDQRAFTMIGQLAHARGWTRQRVRIGNVDFGTLPENRNGLPDTRRWLGHDADRLPELLWVLVPPKQVEEPEPERRKPGRKPRSR